jgi:signal transduction histidine kinase/HPt (histidine-containing phosphotransfer) domain-containing protein
VSPELLADLADIWIFDGLLRSLGASNSASIDPERAELLATVGRTHRPASAVDCHEECTQTVFVPAFDRDGNEIIIGVGQSLAEVTQTFAQQTGADIVLLSGNGSAAPAPEHLWGHRIYALSHASRLRPLLVELLRPQNELTLSGPAVERVVGGRQLMMLRAPLKTARQSADEILFLVDETASRDRISTAVGNNIAANFAALALAAVALWLVMTPVTRRLRRVTEVAPLLAEQKFKEAQAILSATARTVRFPDEIDRLVASVQWLARRLETLLDAEAASEAKSRYVAVMSHEVRTPLNGILGVLELLQHSKLDRDQRESISMVRESAQSLLRVLDDAIDLARIEAGRVDLELRPFLVEDLLEGCAETLAARSRAKGLKLLTVIDPALSSPLLGDTMRLRQVIHNLCGNALKFTASGRVLLRASFEERREGRAVVRFSVTDTGIGISREAQSKLFEPFHQAEATTAERFGGSGLGLSICRGLVQRMGGQIGLDSEPGRGSEFWFRVELAFASRATDPASPSPSRLDGVAVALRIAAADERETLAASLCAAGAVIEAEAPLVVAEFSNSLWVLSHGGVAGRLDYPVRRASLLRLLARACGREPEPETEALQDRPSHRLRVLAVDDHPTNRLVILRQLEMLGHEASCVDDGLQALDRLANQPFDLLITDLRMPGLDGFGLINELRRQEAAGERPQRLPVLVMSAGVLGGESERCIAAGVDGFLPKPLSLTVLREALTRWTACDDVVPAPAQTGPTATSEDAPIDYAVIHELIGDDPVLVAELLGDFVRINTPLVDELRTLCLTQDYEDIAALAHRLLGSARTAGAPPLSNLLATLEKAAQGQNPPSDLASLGTQIVSEFRRLRDFVESPRPMSTRG